MTVDDDLAPFDRRSGGYLGLSDDNDVLRSNVISGTAAVNDRFDARTTRVS
jgi:hypothetical protein